MGDSEGKMIAAAVTHQVSSGWPLTIAVSIIAICVAAVIVAFFWALARMGR
jgi:hypothetical protein